MKDLLEKISSYNILNYLLPGAIFAVVGDSYKIYDLVQNDIVLGLFLYYFIGLVISRFGSLVIGPLMENASFVQFVPYEQYVAAEKKDSKLEVLVEVNNMYRTLCSLFIFLVGLALFEAAAMRAPTFRVLGPPVVLLGLLVLFSCAYRKQTRCIVKRVEANEEK
jgi:hypothetical protein